MRTEKQFIVDELKTKVDATPYLIVTDYTGLKVSQFSDLRGRLRQAGAECRVVKNTFLTRVLKDAGVTGLEGALKGQTAIVFGDGDVAGAAKLIKNFSAEFKLPAIKAGILDRNVLDAKQILALADLPSREVLLAQLLALLQTPATQLARVLNTPAQQLAQVLKAHADKEGN
ncbi:MAG: 50S ribosomal protein L10 [Verrucomicrobium sp.]|nr:50S ribosomal protein L10 [Verrucomicrobium sp.]